MKTLPWESLTEDAVALASKSNPTRIKSPAVVFAGKETDQELALPGDALAAACTKDTGDDVEELETFSVREAEPVPLLLVAVIPMAEVPEVDGDPEIKPVAVLIDKPAGSPVAP